MANALTDPVFVALRVFENERELWDDPMLNNEHFELCVEAAVRIAVLAERKRCVETVIAIWDDYVNTTGDVSGKPYLRGYKDALEDACDGLMEIDTQEGVDAEAVLSAVEDEQRVRREALMEKRRRKSEAARDPEQPEPDTWEVMKRGSASRTRSTEEDGAPTAIEGSEQIDNIIYVDGNGDLDPDGFGGDEYADYQID